MNRKRKSKEGFTKNPNWIHEPKTKGFLKANDKLVLGFIWRWTLGFHRTKCKFEWTWISECTGIHRITIGKIMKKLRNLDLVEYESIKGGKALIKVNTQIPLWLGEEVVDFKSKNEEEVNGYKGSSDRLQGLKPQTSNPPLSKDIYKEKLKYSLKDFKRNWFLGKEGKEYLNKMLYTRYNINYVESAFNSLTPTQQEKAVLSVPRYIQWLCVNPDKIQFIPNASNYILKETYLEYYKSIQTDIDNQIRIEQQKEYEEYLDENKASDEERKEIIESIKKKLGDKNDR